MASTLKKHALKITVALALAASMGGCANYDLKKDPKQWVKNLGDYLNLRNSFLDPSQVGRFDREKLWGTSKPHFEPILDKLDMIEEPNDHWTMATDPLPSDLVVEQKEYVLGEGDVINVSVFELVTPGLPFNDQKVVNELGKITLQNLGPIEVSGLTPTQLEQKIGDIAVEKGIILKKGNGSPGPQVSVQLVQSRARVFNALGQINAGTYNIIGTDFRLLDALALVHDINGGNQPGMDYLYVIRPVKGAGVIPPASMPDVTPMSDPAGIIDSATKPASAPASAPASMVAPSTDPAKAIDSAIKQSAAAPLPAKSPATGDTPMLLRPLPAILPIPLPQVLTADVPAPQLVVPSGLGAAISDGAAPSPVAPTMLAQATMGVPPVSAPATGSLGPGSAIGNGTPPGYYDPNTKQWVTTPNANGNMTPEQAQAAAASQGLPRVIRIPIVKLKEGDPRYNIVIRPGDIINVPNIEPGEFYLAGHVGRPGVYSLTGRKVTLKQAVAAAGGLDSLAIPRRCDLIRRIGDTEVTVQVDLQRIFDGEQPDMYLKANDEVNVGTDPFATFLAVTRNAYRASYGWGFTYDRNLYNQPVITQPTK